ncbi:MAG: nucleotidyl transferase AbiEii/AbiGii toxin family protein, partial [Pseudonocardiaceae bacterium]
MLARIGDRARVTADADATWCTAVTQLQEMLEDAAEADLADHFEFLIGQGRPIQAEGAEGGLRLPVRCLLAGRSFEILRLDLNLVPSDPRPLDRVELRNLFDFTDLPTVVVPAVRVEQQLAEKLHAYTRDYGDQDNSRAKDLYDMIAIAQHLRSQHVDGGDVHPFAEEFG